MRKLFKKRNLLMFIVGFIISTISLAFILFEYKTIQYGKNISGIVVGDISHEDIGHSVPRIEYTYSKKVEVVEPAYLFNTYTIGDHIPLKVYNERVSIPALNNGYWLSLIALLILGTFLFLKGLSLLVKYQRIHGTGQIFLKRYGYKVHARYEKTEDSPQIQNDSIGKIYVLKQVDSDRIFTSQIMSNEYSIKWLEEHLFDVYVHPKNSKKYYIDFEKHFGNLE